MSADLVQEFGQIEMETIQTQLKDQNLFYLEKDIEIKNWYSDVYCLNNNRVTLEGRYIHANRLENHVLNEREQSIIVTQGPLQNTIEDFWEMVFQNKITKIVAIIELKSLGKRCSVYWPFKNSHIQAGNFIIEKNKEESHEFYDYQQIKIKNTKQNIERNLEHFYLHQWADQKDIDGSFYDHYIELLQWINQPKENYIVHCSAGIGWTGTFVMSMLIHSALVFQQKDFDIKKELTDLRHQRYWFVETVPQYQFLYHLKSRLKNL